MLCSSGLKRCYYCFLHIFGQNLFSVGPLGFKLKGKWDLPVDKIRSSLPFLFSSSENFIGCYHFPPFVQLFHHWIHTFVSIVTHRIGKDAWKIVRIVYFIGNVIRFCHVCLINTVAKKIIQPSTKNHYKKGLSLRVDNIT